MDLRIVSVDELESCIFPIIRKAVMQALSEKGTPEGKDLICLSEASTLLGLARSTIYNLVSQRRIPNSKKGKRLYFSRRALLAWVESGRREVE